MRRPWNLVVKACRRWARFRIRRIQPGITVLIVNWNTRDLVLDVIHAVQSLSPADTRIAVVDNGSSDGSSDALRQIPGVRVIRLPANVGHGAALDIGVCAARTDIVVTLDSDAIPLRAGWLEPAVEPVRSGQAMLAGARSKREFAHPVYLAVSTVEFIRRRASFQIFLMPGVSGESAQWGVDAWDTGELLTRQIGLGQTVMIDAGGSRAEVPGGFVGDFVYHHGGVTREAAGAVSPEALMKWRQACRLLGVDLPGASR